MLLNGLKHTVVVWLAGHQTCPWAAVQPWSGQIWHVPQSLHPDELHDTLSCCPVWESNISQVNNVLYPSNRQRLHHFSFSEREHIYIPHSVSAALELCWSISASFYLIVGTTVYVMLLSAPSGLPASIRHGKASVGLSINS